MPGFGCFAASLGRFGRGSARRALMEAEIDILLELLELLLEFVGFKLHLLDLPVDLPHLAFEPADPDKELRSIQFPGVGGIPRLANVSRRAAVSLREVNFVSDRAIFGFRAKIFSAKILGAKARRRGYDKRGRGY